MLYIVRWLWTQGPAFRGKIQFSTPDIMMSTYNSASLNQSYPEMGRHASNRLRTEHCGGKTGSNHHHYLKMFSFFITLGFFFFKNTFLYNRTPRKYLQPSSNKI